MLQFFRSPIHPSLVAYLGHPDAVTSQWVLLNGPEIFLTTVCAYFSLTCILKKLMARRDAFVLRPLMIVYNLMQVMLSAYICKEIAVTAWLDGYKLTCTPCDTSTANGVRMAEAIWYFYLSKYFDLFDTIFFVLRKKNNQITFLHLYHHSSMLFNWYLGTLYSPGGQAFLSVLLNSFVHAIMYTYYMLSAMGPKVQRYLWWKQYLTQLQLVQFIAVNLHLLIGMYHRCKAPTWLNWFTITYVSTLVALFINFYFNAYKITGKSRDKRKANSLIDYKAAGDYNYNKHD